MPEEQVRRGGVTDCRNRTLQQMFLHIGFGEQAGSGFARILRAWREQSWRTPSLNEDPELDTTTLDLRMVHLFPEAVIDELEQRFGGRFRGLDEVQRLALATAATEGRVTNGRMQELCETHPRDLTRLLQELVQGGYVEPHGARRSAWYTLSGGGNGAPQSIPQSSAQTITQTIAQTMSHSGAEEALDVLVMRIKARPWATKDEIRTAILGLCARGPHRTAELANKLGRDDRTIAQNYVRELVREGRLRRLFPDQPRHPHQAYEAVERDE